MNPTNQVDHFDISVPDDLKKSQNFCINLKITIVIHHRNPIIHTMKLFMPGFMRFIMFDGLQFL